MSFRRIRAMLLSNGGLPLVWVLLTGLLLYPVWHQRLLPMLDSANHLALARGWHDYHDPAARIAEFYELRVRVVPYFLFYGTINLLLYVVPIEVANKIFLSAYLILFPLSVLAMARALGRSPWLALFAFPFAFNQNWIYGFSSYLMSVTFSFFALASLVAYLHARRPVWAVTLGVCCVVSYLGHIMPWCLFGLCAICVLLANVRRWQAGVVASAVMLPSVVMAITAVLDEQGEHTYIKDTAFSGVFREFYVSVWEFPRRVMELFPGNLDAVVLAILCATLVALLVWERSQPDARAEDQAGSTTIVRICLWVLGLAYVALPYSIAKPMSWWYVAPRLPSMIMVFVVLRLNPRFDGWRRYVLLPVIVCAVALPLKLARLYRSFSTRNAPCMRFIDELPRAALTLVVVRNMMKGQYSEEKSGDPASSGPVYWHFSSWPMALKDGYSPYAFDQGIPLRPKHPMVVPGWSASDNFSFRQAPGFEWYIVRDATDEMDREPSVKLVKRVGDWTLYHREHAITDEP
jgi:hypothetical protein